MNNKIELLAPAGNFDCLKAAVSNGANAVYLGGKNFSARAFANNFDNDELKIAVEYCHLRSVKVYVTLNTLLNEKEIENAIKLVDYYYNINVDAILIQDLGLYYLIKSKYPDFEIHCSTQMHIHNIQGVINAKKMGFKRVVLARESNLDFIKEACKQDIEIETFIHGAICVSYSGQCLMSSVTKNRSANKGMCAQCCRLKYDLLDLDKNKVSTDTDYLLSPKDMLLINDIPKLIEAGVSSLKIEGRMKSSAYVGYITKMYRKAIDAYYSGIDFNLSSQEMNNLKVLFNRNFTNDYLYQKNDLFGQISPNHLGYPIGKTIGYNNSKVKIKLDSDLSQFDGIRINDFGCIVNMLYKDGLLTNEAKKGEFVEIKVDHNVNGVVYKTLDYNLEKQINEFQDKKTPIDLYVSIHPDKNVLVKCNDFIFDSNVKALNALKQPLDEDSVIKQFSKLNETPFILQSCKVDTNNAFLPIKVLNDIRREFIDKYIEYLLKSFKRQIIETNLDIYDYCDDDNEDIYEEDNSFKSDNTSYDLNYVINPKSKYSDSNNSIICEVGGILNHYNKKIAYYTLNISNSYGYEFLKSLGFNSIILSSELKDNEIDDLIYAYKNRTNKDIHPLVYSDGNRVLMYIKANPLDKYSIKDGFSLTDGTNTYKIRKNSDITELIEQKNEHSLYFKAL